jgi:hypothetical protein
MPVAPRVARRVQSHFDLPLWSPFFLAAIATGLIFWCDRRRLPSHCCQGCGYNLTGNTSGVCPECGQKAEREDSSTTEVTKGTKQRRAAKLALYWRPWRLGGSIVVFPLIAES